MKGSAARSGSVLVTNGSVCGSGRSKNIRIRIRNTPGLHWDVLLARLVQWQWPTLTLSSCLSSTILSSAWSGIPGTPPLKIRSAHLFASFQPSHSHTVPFLSVFFFSSLFCRLEGGEGWDAKKPGRGGGDLGLGRAGRRRGRSGKRPSLMAVFNFILWCRTTPVYVHLVGWHWYCIKKWCGSVKYHVGSGSGQLWIRK